MTLRSTKMHASEPEHHQCPVNTLPGEFGVPHPWLEVDQWYSLLSKNWLMVSFVFSVAFLFSLLLVLSGSVRSILKLFYWVLEVKLVLSSGNSDPLIIILSLFIPGNFSYFQVYFVYYFLWIRVFTVCVYVVYI